MHEPSPAGSLDGSSSLVEVSGGVTIDRIAELSAIEGVDFISVGALTHSVKSTDISLDIQVDTSA